MIENLRKYTVLIIVLFVLVIIGFIMMDANTMQKSQGGVAYLKIADRTYTDRDIMKYGSSAYQVAESLVEYGFSRRPRVRAPEHDRERRLIRKVLSAVTQESVHAAEVLRVANVSFLET